MSVIKEDCPPPPPSQINLLLQETSALAHGPPTNSSLRGGGASCAFATFFLALASTDSGGILPCSCPVLYSHCSRCDDQESHRTIVAARRDANPLAVARSGPLVRPPCMTRSRPLGQRLPPFSSLPSVSHRSKTSSSSSSATPNPFDARQDKRESSHRGKWST